MYVKLKISKAVPGKAERYAMEKNILDHEIRRNLFSSSLTPAGEMIQTAKRFGKYKSENERKTFGLVFSPDPRDNPTEDQLVEIIETTMDRFFPNHQCVIVLHRDKKGTADNRKANPVLHGHCYGSVIDPVSGKSMHVSQGELNEMRKWIDEYAIQRYGWRPLERSRDQKSHSRYSLAALKALQAKGVYSWRLDMASRIERHYNEAESYQDFLYRLNSDGIGVVSRRRSRKTDQEYQLPELMFSFNYRGKTMMVRGSNISDKLTPSEINRRFDRGGIDNVRSEGRYTFTQTTGPQRMGSGPRAGQQRGQDNGEKSKSVGGGKIDFRCLECTHDKEICAECCRHDLWDGGRNVRDARTR